jgi:hypothetical protein
MVAVDHLGPFKKTANGNQHVIVCIDYLTRWIEVKAVKDTGSDSAIVFLRNNVFLQHGSPRRIISDRGPAFSSLVFEAFMNEWRVRHIFASAEHPETNGLVEKVNGTLVATLAAFVNFEHNNWDQGLQEAAFSINTAKQSTTQITPFELVYGRTVFLPHEASFPWPPTDKETADERKKKVESWRKVARRLIFRRQQKSKLIYDRHRKPSPLYEPGDLVLVARKPRSNGRTKKFLIKFVGPYQVLERVSKTCYKVEDLPSHRRKRVWRRFNVHASQLRRYFPRREIDWLPEEEDDTEEEVSGCGEDWPKTSTGEIGKGEQNEYSEIYQEAEEGVREVINPTTTRIGRLSLPPVRFIAG